MGFKTFEEIIAWQLARELCGMIRQFTERERFSKDWELRRQVRSAAGSVMDCIAEGFERANNKEFKYFLGISKGSCGEVRSQMYRALDSGYINEQERLELNLLCKRTGKALQKLIEYLNQTEERGQRFWRKNDNNLQTPDDPEPPNPPLQP